MTGTKMEIIKLILENDNADKAVRILSDIIDFLKQNEASEEQVVAFLQRNCQESL